jgi:hypothetical protein
VIETYTDIIKTNGKSGDDIQKKQNAAVNQIRYRTIVEGGIKYDGAEMSKIEAIEDMAERRKLVVKKFSGSEKMLLTIDSGRITIHTVKLKD